MRNGKQTHAMALLALTLLMVILALPAGTAQPGLPAHAGASASRIGASLPVTVSAPYQANDIFSPPPPPIPVWVVYVLLGITFTIALVSLVGAMKTNKLPKDKWGTKVAIGIGLAFLGVATWMMTWLPSCAAHYLECNLDAWVLFGLIMILGEMITCVGVFSIFFKYENRPFASD
jgi:hypothetical protein